VRRQYLTIHWREIEKKNKPSEGVWQGATYSAIKRLN
jgi:hypothetical protein